jgi:CHASE2 domain-containing sensor protein
LHPHLVLSQRQQVGFNNVVVDADGKVRRSLLYWHVDGEAHKSFALQLALVYLKAEGITPKKAQSNPQYLQLGRVSFALSRQMTAAMCGRTQRLSSFSQFSTRR